MKIIQKTVMIAMCMFFVAVSIYVLVFFLRPSLVVDFYRSSNEHDIFVRVKPFGIEKEISGTPHYKANDGQWSPQKTYFAYFDNIQEYTEQPFAREWALQVVDPRNFVNRTIFIGDYKISEYKWIDNNTVRVYVSAGSGVRIYRDMPATAKQAFVAADHLDSSFWIPERTF